MINSILRSSLRSGSICLSMFVLIFQINVFAQTISNNPDTNLHSFINDLVVQGFEEGQFPGISMALFYDDSVHYYHQGHSKLETESSVNPSTLFHLGSIGKLLTAIAVLQQVDEGTLDLHRDIGEYITFTEKHTSLRESNPITLHCLLTHSCGYNDVNIGYMAKDEESLLSLEQFVFEFDPGLFQEPGTDIVYSNYSYALAGFIVEKVSGLDFKSYIEEYIFQPLEMTNSTLDFPYEYRSDTRFATGYRKADRGFIPVDIFPRHAIPAGSLISNSEDMSLFIQALFNRDSKLLSDESWKQFYTQHFTNHELLNGYSYGLERQNINGNVSWAKGGMVPGFLSQIHIVPDEFALFAVTNTDDDIFGENFHKQVTDFTTPNSIRLKDSVDVGLSAYTGVYRDKRYNRNTEENVVSLFRGQFNIYQNTTNDALLIYHNGSWNSYIHIGDHVFQNSELPYEFLVFKLDFNQKVIGLYRNSNIGGLTVATSYEKTKWYNSPVFINEYYGFIPILAFTGFFFLFGNLVVRAIRIKKKEFLTNKIYPTRLYITLAVTLLLLLFHTYFVPFQILRQTQVFLIGYPFSFQLFSVLGYLLIPLVLLFGYIIWKSWSTKSGGLLSRIYLSLIQLSLVLHICYLAYWNFL